MKQFLHDVQHETENYVQFRTVRPTVKQTKYQTLEIDLEMTQILIHKD